MHASTDGHTQHLSTTAHTHTPRVRVRCETARFRCRPGVRNPSSPTQTCPLSASRFHRQRSGTAAGCCPPAPTQRARVKTSRHTHLRAESASAMRAANLRLRRGRTTICACAMHARQEVARRQGHCGVLDKAISMRHCLLCPPSPAPNASAPAACQGCCLERVDTHVQPG